MAVPGVIGKIYDKAIRRQFAEAEARQALLANTHRSAPGLIKQIAAEVLQLVKEGLMRDGIVRVHNFGIFRLKMAKARGGYNPHTKEKIRISARPRVVFTPAKVLRERIEPCPRPIIKLDKEPQIMEFPAGISPITVKTPAAPQLPIAVKPHNGVTPPIPISSDNGFEAAPVIENATQQPSHYSEPPPRHTQVIHDDVVEDGNTDLNQEIVHKKIPAAEMEKPAIGSSATSLTEPRDRDEKQTDYRRWAVFAVILAVIGLMIWLYPEHEAGPLSGAGNADTAQPETGAAALEQETRIATAPIADTTAETEKTTITDPVVVTDNDPSIEAQPVIVATDIDTNDEIDAVAGADEITDSDITEPPTTVKAAFFDQTEYRITEGDSLWRLARRFYVNPYFWPYMYRSNHGLIQDPNRIEANDLITLPELIGPPDALTAQDRRRIAQGYFMLYEYYKKIAYKHPHHALLGVQWFDKEVLRQNQDRIETIDEQKLHANRKDNDLITAAFSENSQRAIR